MVGGLVHSGRSFSSEPSRARCVFLIRKCWLSLTFPANSQWYNASSLGFRPLGLLIAIQYLTLAHPRRRSNCRVLSTPNLNSRPPPLSSTFTHSCTTSQDSIERPLIESPLGLHLAGLYLRLLVTTKLSLFLGVLTSPK